MEATVAKTPDSLWLAYDKAVSEDSELWKAEFRRRIESEARAAALREVAEKVRLMADELESEAPDGYDWPASANWQDGYDEAINNVVLRILAEATGASE